MSDTSGQVQELYGASLDVSRLEASLVQSAIPPRSQPPWFSSNGQNDTAQASTDDAMPRLEELDFRFRLDPTLNCLRHSNSLQDSFAVVQYQKHHENQNNFSVETRIDYLQFAHGKGSESSES
jgi:hypothetical protein